MSGGLYQIVDAINAIGAASLTADELVKKLLADATAAKSATAGITGGAGGSGGAGAMPGGAGGPNATGGYTHGAGVKTTVRAAGQGLPADVIAFLKSFGGR